MYLVLFHGQTVAGCAEREGWWVERVSGRPGEASLLAQVNRIGKAVVIRQQALLAVHFPPLFSSFTQTYVHF